jgi:hypothetical protein
MATLYLLNSPVLPDFGHYQFEGPISMARAQNMASGGFVSAIGHEGAASLMSQLLDQSVQMCRKRIRLFPGDRALVLRLGQRLPEGRVLSYQELSQMPFELGILKCLS